MIQSRNSMPLLVILSTILGILYVATAPTSLPDADAGEFILLSKFPGIAHPPGYPLYVGISRLWASFDLFPSLVFQLSLFSILSATVAAFALGAFLISYSLSPLVAFVSVLCIFSTRSVWRIATTVEPFALSLLLMSLVVFTSYQLLRKRDGRPQYSGFAIIGLLYGLGFSNHHMLVLFAPLTLACMIRAAKFDSTKWSLQLCVFAAGFVLGALPVLSLLNETPGTVLTWGPIENLRTLKSHLLREDYGTFTLSPGVSKTGAAIYFWRLVPNEMGVFFSVFTVMGICAVGFGRKLLPSLSKGTPQSFFAWLMLGELLLVTLGFFSLCNVVRTGPGEVILQRFMHVGFFLLAYFLAVGLESQMRRMASLRWNTATFGAIFAVMLGIQIVQQRNISDRSREVFAEQDVKNIYQLVGEDPAILVTFSDAEIMGSLYGQAILGRGKDVVVIQPALWGHDRYRASALAQLGHSNPRMGWKQAVQTVAGRTVYFTSFDSDLEGWPGKLLPRVRLLRWYPKEPPKNVEAIVDHDIASFAFGLDRPVFESSMSAWEEMLFARYRTWFQQLASVRRKESKF